MDEFVIEDMDDGRTLVVTGRWTRSAEEAVLRPDVDAVWLNYARGYSEVDLSFVDGWPIRRLLLIDRSVTDLSPLSRLSDTLEELSVQAAPGTRLDLSTLPNLRKLGAGWDEIRESLYAPDHLSSLLVTEYDERDLSPLSVQPSLQNLEIKVARRLESLDGVASLPTLSRIRLAAAPRLAELAELALSRATLREFSIELSRSFEAIDPLGELEELRFLEIGDCGSIASLQPISSLHRLEQLYAWGTTRIADGDLSPLMQLPRLREVRMRDRREYRPRLEAVKARLGHP